MLVEIDGELRHGGVDDVYEQMEQDAEEDEDLFAIHPSRLTGRHRFFGSVEVKSRKVLSEKGCSLLENEGADLSTLDEGGVIYVRVRGIFHRYETSCKQLVLWYENALAAYQPVFFVQPSLKTTVPGLRPSVGRKTTHGICHTGWLAITEQHISAVELLGNASGGSSL
ncbi:hypothetical protein FRC01_002009 [Tulasnella sp. 417]|nr:hypothetical protein FRC01_002009 [Tulasnella sp. 417]